MKESYINYAMSVIIGRALPDVRDMDANAPFDRRELQAPAGGANIFDLFNGNFEKEYQRQLKKKT